MKMVWGLFGGMFIILIGLSIILNVIFKVNIPFFRILFGLFIIFLGIKIIFGGCWPCKSWQTKKDVVFEETAFSGIPAEREYNAIFGKADIDLTNLTLTEPVTHLKVTAIFGSAEIKLGRELPVKINSDAVFGGVQLPDRSGGGFGSLSWNSGNFNENEKYLDLKAEAIFGSIRVFYPQR
ncbi:hypothetical protein KAR34_07915 [bacterium]|nr:hypothetical protein [bacterium]